MEGPRSPRVSTPHADLSLEEIASALPGTGEVMASVGRCYAICWHAAGAGNFDLAAYFLRRVRGLLRGLAVTRPKYAAQITEFDAGCLEPAYQALMARDMGAFDSAYQRSVDEANRYHVDTGHAYIRWVLPDESPDQGLLLN